MKRLTRDQLYDLQLLYQQNPQIRRIERLNGKEVWLWEDTIWGYYSVSAPLEDFPYLEVGDKIDLKEWSNRGFSLERIFS